ncbi:MAG: Argininosuccinate synthase [Candidatus Gottesmanbacteria bacterium GW2011_GWA1_34_13]|uniref:Argininosuccinate synthase n=1 Tax=Candidatus Gottesmanbacteria bacterium GW2011_GWA1_34_13 TaxID=1618434 RepID=A0A0G0ASC4_9BACT|nr:MAG: Argininosuccinate synthase [Candidatus Gottesmanbacteria bacterium GW2011_GWA1_34_13]
MNNLTNYKKVASYEAIDVKKVLLLYSGGLDTSVMLKWIKEKYNAQIIALTLDLGQQKDDLEAIKNKALKLGAVKAITLDVKEEFAQDFLSFGIKANAIYQGDYHLSTPMGRALIAKKAVEMAKKEQADCIAHGCTGKGNDQVRLEGYALTLNPLIKIIFLFPIP